MMGSSQRMYSVLSVRMILFPFLLGLLGRVQGSRRTR